jgi:hypothetical protein
MQFVRLDEGLVVVDVSLVWNENAISRPSQNLTKGHWRKPKPKDNKTIKQGGAKSDNVMGSLRVRATMRD